MAAAIPSSSVHHCVLTDVDFGGGVCAAVKSSDAVLASPAGDVYAVCWLM